MSTLTVTFEGFCALYEHSTPWKMYVPTGHHPHVGALVMSGESLDAEYTSWWPDLVTMDPAGDQLLVWLLKGRRLQLSAPDVSSWNTTNLATVIDLSKVHTGATAVLGPAAKTGGIIELGKGDFTIPKGTGLTNNDIQIAKDGVVESTQKRAEQIAWTGSALSGTVSDPSKKLPDATRDYIEDTVSGGRIVFAPSAVDVRASITNSGSGGNGLSHFHNFYDLLKLADGDTEAKLTEVSGGGPINSKTGVNCIPPSRLPK